MRIGRCTQKVSQRGKYDLLERTSEKAFEGGQNTRKQLRKTLGYHKRPFARSCQPPIEGRIKKGLHGMDRVTMSLPQRLHNRKQSWKECNSILVMDGPRQFDSYLLLARKSRRQKTPELLHSEFFSGGHINENNFDDTLRGAVVGQTDARVTEQLFYEGTPNYVFCQTQIINSIA